MRKILSFVLTVCILLSGIGVFPLNAGASDITSGTCGENLSWNYDVSAATLTVSGKGKMDDYSSGNYLSGWTTTAPWKEYYNYIQTVVIEDGVTGIGSFAFFNCFVITSVTVPGSVTSIGTYAFCDCSSLQSVTIPDSVTEISAYSFAGCLSLTSVTVPDSVTDIDYCAFSNCSGLESVTLGKSVSYIAEEALFGPNLKEIIVPEENTSFMSEDGILFTKDKTVLMQFPAGKSDKSYTVPDSVTYIGGCSFYCCKNIEKVTIPDGVATVSGNAFAYCTSLTTVIVPDSVNDIGDFSFEYSDNLSLFCTSGSYTEAYAVDKAIPYVIIDGITGIKISSLPARTVYPLNGELNTYGLSLEVSYDDGSKRSVTKGFTVGEYDFSTVGKKSVTVDFFGFMDSFTVTVDKNTVVYPESEHPYKPEADQTWVYTHDTDAAGLDITFSQDTYTEPGCDVICILDKDGNTVGEYSGDELAGTSVYVPGNTFSIQFYSDPSIEFYGFSIDKIEENSVRYQYNATTKTLTFTGNGAMEDYSWENEVPWGCYRDAAENIVIGDGITCIGEMAFQGFLNVTSVTIADSVRIIGYQAFAGCRSLAYVTLPGSVTKIDENAFSSCSGLVSVNIPDSVINIGGYAFSFCNSLKEIYVSEKNPAYSSQNGVLFNKDKTELICYPARNSETEYKIPNTVRFIGDGAFNCARLTSLDIPDGVLSLGLDVFSYSNLEHISVPDSVTNIENWTFFYCQQLSEITVSEENGYYTSQDGVLFNKDKTHLIQYPVGNKRTEYTVPDSVKTIFGNAFSYSAYLTFVTLPDSVEYIEDGALSFCKNLTSVTVPPSVEYIGWNTFNESNNLTLRCANGSYAEEYAIERNIPYVLFANITGIKIVSLPEKTVYPLNGKLKTHGLSLKISCEDGYEYTVSEGFTVGSYDFSTPGEKTVTVDYCGYEASFKVKVDANMPDYPESFHPYEPFTDETWTYTQKTAANSLDITFSSDTYTEPGCDYIYIFDKDGNDIGCFSGDELAGKTVNVPGNSFTIRFVSDLSVEFYGFSISGIKANGTPDGPIRGDIDGNRKVNASDSLTLKKLIVGRLNRTLYPNCDVNGDGKINTADALLLKRLIVGKV